MQRDSQTKICKRAQSCRAKIFNADCNNWNHINQNEFRTTIVVLRCRHKDCVPVLHVTCMQTLKPYTNDANGHIVHAATIREGHILCCLPAVCALTDISQAAANYTSPKARQNVFSNMKTFVFQGSPPTFLRRCLISIRNLSWYKCILHSRVLAANVPDAAQGGKSRQTETSPALFSAYDCFLRVGGVMSKCFVSSLTLRFPFPPRKKTKKQNSMIAVSRTSFCSNVARESTILRPFDLCFTCHLPFFIFHFILFYACALQWVPLFSNPYIYSIYTI